MTTNIQSSKRWKIDDDGHIFYATDDELRIMAYRNRLGKSDSEEWESSNIAEWLMECYADLLIEDTANV